MRFATLIIYLLLTLPTWAQGIPYFLNITAQEYNAHNFNFDIISAPNGFTFVANFEGLLYYDNATWRIIHTPNLSRVTVVYLDHNNTVWLGGYNFIGSVQPKPNGEPYLQRIGKPNVFQGEVQEIWEENDILYFVVDDGYIYKMKDDKIVQHLKYSNKAKTIGLSDIVDIDAIKNGSQDIIYTDTTQILDLVTGQQVIVRKGKGLTITSQTNKELYTLSEDNGLTTNFINWVSDDGHGRVWSASENGINTLSIPSSYSHFTENEGLKGEVYSMTEYAGKIYVGTTNGLYRLNHRTFQPVGMIGKTCWALVKSDKGLYAATADGIYLVSSDDSYRLISSAGALSLFVDGQRFYSGEMDGVYLNDNNTRQKVCKLEKVSKIIKGHDGTMWLLNIYGEIWMKRPTDKNFYRYKKSSNNEEVIYSIVDIGNKIEVVTSDSDKPFPFPLFSYLDQKGVLWLSNAEGKSLYRWKDGSQLTDMTKLLYPLKNTTVRAMIIRDENIWIGGDDGVTIINTHVDDPHIAIMPKMMIRSVELNGDSILWGGYGEMPTQLPDLDSDDNNLIFKFSLDYLPLVGETLYRYRLNNDQWSAWSNENEARFISLPYGSYTFKVEALDAFGRQIRQASINFSIDYPIYMRWYMYLVYLLITAFLVYLLFQWRLHRLEIDKLRLEKIVEERTAEVKNAQNQLIKQAKMVTVGKLTQGLIDRILNPLNYINNFAKLSEGLVKDIEANIDDEKDQMSQDNYEDTLDVLGMLRGNLQKVGEHGQNTTRTLKAMEEMLKDRTSGVVISDIINILKQDEEMVNTYYAQQIKDYVIQVTFDYPSDQIMVACNPDLLSKVIMSMLNNSIYAIEKKFLRQHYQPELSLKTIRFEDKVFIKVRDTGIGIEKTILDKIFDPFFTTKTTGEASGIGLYLSNDIIQNYGGIITVNSVKDEFTEFTITLPTTN